MYQQTSFLAYQELITTGQINRKQGQILKAMIEHPFPLTNLEISKITNLPINSITGRVKELRDKGLVQKAYIKKEPRASIAWKVAYDIAL